jgi:aminoglycoside 2''-phosphotransferase
MQNESASAVSSGQPDWQRIEQENSGLRIRTARLIGEGWNARAYLVNDELVFRCPKRSEHWEELNGEIAFLRFAAAKLPLPVPRYIQAAPHSSAAPHGYAVYRHLPGHPLATDKLSAANCDAVAASLAEFLRALHALPGAVGITLPREDGRLTAHQNLADAERHIFPKLSRQAASALMRILQDYLDASEKFSYAPVVLHADFSRDHILMQNATVTGVIDFGDVNWGDRDYDFMYLFLGCGLAFAEQVARRYGHPDLVGLRSKLMYFALADQIDTIVHGADLALAGQREAAWTQMKTLLDL